jgi:cytochrome d ubiquinol oxidase subunit II
MSVDLPFIWAGLIAFAVLAYVILDGFDLGVGILFPFFPSRADRDTLMNSVIPVWDGNETWLVLGGGGLFATFPLAYAVILPALYTPIIAMLLGLIFRGVAFEFRWRTDRARRLWDWAFATGSAVAALAQGIALGALVQGIPIQNRLYVGGWWDWLTPFSVFTGLALMSGYALLGATWLIMKTDAKLQERARSIAWVVGPATLILIAAVSLWTPFLHPEFMARWFSWPSGIYVGAVPIFVALLAFLLLEGLRNAREVEPFIATLGLFILCYIGLGISFYPYIVPHSISIWDAAAPDKSLSFLLVGAIVLIPVILAYTAYSYWVFRGKVGPEGGYH